VPGVSVDRTVSRALLVPRRAKSKCIELHSQRASSSSPHRHPKRQTSRLSRQRALNFAACDARCCAREGCGGVVLSAVVLLDPELDEHAIQGVATREPEGLCGLCDASVRLAKRLADLLLVRFLVAISVPSSASDIASESTSKRVSAPSSLVMGALVRPAWDGDENVATGTDELGVFDSDALTGSIMVAMLPGAALLYAF
jgi:hypothetical protein